METQSKVLRAQWVHQDLTECKVLQDPREIMAYRGHLVLQVPRVHRDAQVQMDLMDFKVFLATMDCKALKETQESLDKRDPKALLGKTI